MRPLTISSWRHHRYFAKTLAISILFIYVSGCALKDPPSHEELRQQTLEHASVPAHWSGGADGAVVDGWLSSFKDPALADLVREALQYNVDLKVAAARVEQAAGYARVAGAAIYPSVTLLARGGGELSGDNSGLTGGIVSASWELDLWGRVRAGRAAAVAQYDSTASDYLYARQSLGAAVAKSWFLAIEAGMQKNIADEMVMTGEQLVKLARERQRIGASDEYDVAVAEASLGTIRDTQAQLALGVTQARRALEVLLGRYPAASIETATQLPALPPPVPAGLPSQLLERRPDVVAAERRVAAAFHRVSESQAARLPKISLTAGVSSISSDLFVLTERDNPVWSAGASLLAPIFTGGALAAQVDIRTAEQQQALAEYARTGLNAFHDVENALSSEFTLQARERILAKAVDDNRRAMKLAEVRYRVGAIDLRAVSQQQLALLAAQTALLRVRSEARIQRVNLHLALGGNFEVPPATTPPPAQPVNNTGVATR